MAKKEIKEYVKLQIKGGQANPAPPVGPALGQRGINIMEFCKAFNEKTKKLKKKMPKYIIKSIVNLFLLRFDKSVYYFSKILAFNKFKNFLKSN